MGELTIEPSPDSSHCTTPNSRQHIGAEWVRELLLLGLGVFLSMYTSRRQPYWRPWSIVRLVSLCSVGGLADSPAWCVVAWCVRDRGILLMELGV